MGQIQIRTRGSAGGNISIPRGVDYSGIAEAASARARGIESVGRGISDAVRKGINAATGMLDLFEAEDKRVADEAAVKFQTSMGQWAYGTGADNPGFYAEMQNSADVAKTFASAFDKAKMDAAVAVGYDDMNDRQKRFFDMNNAAYLDSMQRRGSAVSTKTWNDSRRKSAAALFETSANTLAFDRSEENLRAWMEAFDGVAAAYGWTPEEKKAQRESARDAVVAQALKGVTDSYTTAEEFSALSASLSEDGSALGSVAPLFASLPDERKKAAINAIDRKKIQFDNERLSALNDEVAQIEFDYHEGRISTEDLRRKVVEWDEAGMPAAQKKRIQSLWASAVETDNAREVKRLMSGRVAGTLTDKDVMEALDHMPDSAKGTSAWISLYDAAKTGRAKAYAAYVDGEVSTQVSRALYNDWEYVLSVDDRLRILSNESDNEDERGLLQRGLITADEYAKYRKQILADEDERLNGILEESMQHLFDLSGEGRLSFWEFENGELDVSKSYTAARRYDSDLNAANFDKAASVVKKAVDAVRQTAIDNPSYSQEQLGEMFRRLVSPVMETVIKAKVIRTDSSEMDRFRQSIGAMNSLRYLSDVYGVGSDVPQGLYWMASGSRDDEARKRLAKTVAEIQAMGNPTAFTEKN